MSGTCALSHFRESRDCAIADTSIHIQKSKEIEILSTIHSSAKRLGTSDRKSTSRLVLLPPGGGGGSNHITCGGYYICLLGFWASGAKTLRGQQLRAGATIYASSGFRSLGPKPCGGNNVFNTRRPRTIRQPLSAAINLDLDLLYFAFVRLFVCVSALRHPYMSSKVTQVRIFHYHAAFDTRCFSFSKFFLNRKFTVRTIHHVFRFSWKYSSRS